MEEELEFESGADGGNAASAAGHEDPWMTELPQRALSFGGAMNDEVQLGDTAPITEDVLASTASSAGASGAASAPAPGRTSTSEAEAIRVAIRIRPLSEKEKLVNPVATIDINSNTSITMKAPEGSHAFKSGEMGGTFTYSDVFGPTENNEQLFSKLMANTVDDAVLVGKHGLLFAYGMTGSGKTYTVAGKDADAGLLVRTLSRMFNKIEEQKLNVNVVVTYVEIYNENIYDLLASLGEKTAGAGAGASSMRSAGVGPRAGGAAAGRPGLEIKSDKEGRKFVSGAKQVMVFNRQAAVELLTEGARSKAVAETALNAESSRSHTVFSISMWKRKDGYAALPVPTTGMQVMDIVAPTGVLTPGFALHSRLSIVDLAGSERANRTQAAATQLKEAGAINNSLINLMQCLEAMRKKEKGHVSFRNSKLTWLFSDYLGGATSGTTIMVVNAGPAASDYDETLQAVKYGAVVKDVQVVKQKVDTRWDSNLYDADGRRVQKRGAGEMDADGAAAAAGDENVDPAGAAANGKVKRPAKPEPTHASRKAGKAVKGSLGATSSSNSLKSSGSFNLGSTAGSAITTATGAVAGGVKKPRVEGSAADDAPADFNSTSATSGVQPGFVSQADYDRLQFEMDTLRSTLSATEDAKLNAEHEKEEAECQVSELEEAIQTLVAQNNKLSEEYDDAMDRAEGIEEETRADMAEEMERQREQLESQWAAKMSKREAEWKDTLSKLHNLLKLHSVRSGRSKRGSSIAGLMSDLGVGASLGIDFQKLIRDVDAKNDDAEDKDTEEADENEEENEDDDETSQLKSEAAAAAQRIFELEAALSSSASDVTALRASLSSVTAEVTSLRSQIQVMQAHAAEAAGQEAVRTAQLQNEIDSYKEQAQSSSNAAMEASQAAADAAEATMEARTAAEEADAKARKAESALSTATAQLEVARSEVTRLQSTIDDQASQLDSLRSELANAREDAATAEEEAQAAKSMHETLAASVDGYKSKIAELNKRNDYFTSSFTSLQAKEKALNDEVTSLKGENKQLNQQLAAANAAAAAAPAVTVVAAAPEPCATCQSSSAELASLRSKLAALEQEVADKARTIEKLSDELNEAEAALDAANSSNSANAAAAEEKDARITALEGSESTLQLRIEALEEANGELQATKSDLESRLAASDSSLASTTARMGELEQAVSEAQSIISAAEQQRVEFESQIAALQASLSTLAVEKDAMVQAVDQLRTALAAAEDKAAAAAAVAAVAPSSSVPEVPMVIEAAADHDDNAWGDNDAAVVPVSQESHQSQRSTFDDFLSSATSRKQSAAAAADEDDEGAIDADAEPIQPAKGGRRSRAGRGSRGASTGAAASRGRRKAGSTVGAGAAPPAEEEAAAAVVEAAPVVVVAPAAGKKRVRSKSRQPSAAHAAAASSSSAAAAESAVEVVAPAAEAASDDLDVSIAVIKAQAKFAANDNTIDTPSHEVIANVLSKDLSDIEAVKAAKSVASGAAVPPLSSRVAGTIAAGKAAGSKRPAKIQRGDGKKIDEVVVSDDSPVPVRAISKSTDVGSVPPSAASAASSRLHAPTAASNARAAMASPIRSRPAFGAAAGAAGDRSGIKSPIRSMQSPSRGHAFGSAMSPRGGVSAGASNASAAVGPTAAAGGAGKRATSRSRAAPGSLSAAASASAAGSRAAPALKAQPAVAPIPESPESDDAGAVSDEDDDEDMDVKHAAPLQAIAAAAAAPSKFKEAVANALSGKAPIPLAPTPRVASALSAAAASASAITSPNGRAPLGSRSITAASASSAAASKAGIAAAGRPGDENSGGAPATSKASAPAARATRSTRAAASK